MRTKTLLLAVAVTLALHVGPLCQKVWSQTPAGTLGQPLEGRRYETLSALAHRLDETAQGALEGANDDAQRGAWAAARALAPVRTFARRASDFHATIDNYPNAPFDVLAELANLTTLAQQVNERIHAAQGLESTHDDWAAILVVLDRMRRCLNGDEVIVPPPHVVAALSGERLHEFRQLANDLDLTATRAHDSARRDLGRYPARGPQFLGELKYFSAQSRDLHRRAHLGQVSPQEIGPIVDHVLEDARRADRRMRDAEVFAPVWSDSGRMITILQRMASLARS